MGTGCDGRRQDVAREGAQDGRFSLMNTDKDLPNASWTEKRENQSTNQSTSLINKDDAEDQQEVAYITHIITETDKLS